ncbi:MAG: OmpA family protein, partial [Cytophagaceae bacterium]
MSVRGVLTGAVFTLIWLWGGHDAVSLSKVNQQISFARNVTPESINLIETDKDSTIAQDSLGIELRALRKKLKNAQVKQFGEGIKVTFESGIFFEFDSFVLTSEARDNIEILTNIIANFESSGILIEGHTDYIGSKSYNQHLSERRASMVAEHLISQGLSPEVIKVK